MIFLARHGKTVYNSKKLLNGQYDDPLTEEGETQAIELAKKCSDLGIRIIYSSWLTRAFVTARIVAKILKINKVTALEDLMERDFGFMTHQPESKISELPDTLKVSENSIYFLSGDGVETFSQLVRRVEPVYYRISREQDRLKDVDDCNALIVSHGDVMKAIEAIHRNTDILEVLKEGHYQNCQIVPLV